MKTSRRLVLFLTATLCVGAGIVSTAWAQQTLGGITGTVSDSSGGVIPGTTVTAVGDQTKLTRKQNTNDSGLYSFVNLPIGNYTLTFERDGFQTLKVPTILVQADRTVTLNEALKIGEAAQSVTVVETPLVNAVDTTNGYVLDTVQLEAIPLSTGSFTGLVTLSPGVNAELSGGTGANSGLGNQPVWANGQRDTSNSFLLNGVDASNIFNGKSTSQVNSARIVNNTGVSQAFNLSAIPVQSTASIYLAIGEAIPTPAPETIQEFRVNTSMYDAQQGSTSGAHVDMSTASGTNNIHGSAYIHRGTDWLNAAPFFYNADPGIPASEKVPELHRYTAGGTIGLPIKKDKLFLFASYQHVHDSDQEIGISRPSVPFGLTDSNRTAAGLAAIANTDFNDPNFAPDISASDINPISLALMNYKLPNGQYLFPSANNNTPSVAFPENAEIPGTAYFIANQAVADLDWNPNTSHSFAAKYYYQHDPSIAPYGYSSVSGFTQHLDAGSQVASLNHTQILRPNLSVTEIFGFVREKAYSTIDQPFTTSQLAAFVQKFTGASAAQSTINNFGSPFFPGISIVDDLGPTANLPYLEALNIGAGAASQGAFTGMFQNRFMPSANAIWTKGKHTITFGGSFAYTQLNTRDERSDLGMISFPNFSNFVTGQVSPAYIFNSTAYLAGDANRYYRANATGEYIQDKYQLRPNLSVTAGLRFDWDGGLSEKYGRIYNFDPSKYAYDPTTDTITSTGFIIAGNNAKFPTAGVSDTTLTGRQWGFAPRIGIAWSPKMFNDKVVVRAGWGMYYDRGELFTYLSPGYSANETSGGPFGVNQSQPFVNTQQCTSVVGVFPILCDPSPSPGAVNGYSFATPWGDTKIAAPNGNPAIIAGELPNAAALSDGAEPYFLAGYARNNKLPYTMNSTLDIQWQPRRDLAIEIGYVGALGRHEIIPLPFNQSRIASPSNPLCGPANKCTNANASHFAQSYTYGYTVEQPAGCEPFAGSCAGPISLPNGQAMLQNFEGGNVDLRVPYIGYANESELYTAAGVSNYNALQAHVEKRMSHGLQVGFSYTFSHSLDEQSAMGLFYNGNNPLDLRDGYGSSDFDRTHVLNFDYRYELPKFFSTSSWEAKFADGWAIQGVTVLQSGQPYSVIDYSGAVGSIFYSTFNGITNPIVPLDFSKCTAKTALTGAVGADPNAPALNASCFTVPLLAPGDLNGAIPPGDTFETNFTSRQRNIFRQSWQRRADISIVKLTQLTERVAVKYSLDVYNLTNTPSFDIPIDNVTQNFFLSPNPVINQPPRPTGCDSTNRGFYSCPNGVGQVTKTIGSPRQIQMTLSLQF